MTHQTQQLPSYRFRSAVLAETASKQAATMLALGRQRVKAAIIGGEQESSFEKAFAALAFTYLKDKAPRLLDYLVGFQLIDRDDDGTKACGIFGFKLDKQWVYAPVFFLNGELKGHELLYLKSQDQFVPLKDAWVNHTLSQRPFSLGEPRSMSSKELGSGMPDLRSLTTPPMGAKYGSASAVIADWHPAIRAIAPQLGQWATQNPKNTAKFAGLDERFGFEKLARSDLRFWKLAHDVFSAMPALDACVTKLYGPTFWRDSLLDIRKQATDAQGARLLGLPGKPAVDVLGASVLGASVKKASSRAPSLEILTQLGQEPVGAGLSEGEKQRFVRDGYFIRDKRAAEEVSTAYSTQMVKAIINPPETGIYQVLADPLAFEKCLVLCSPHSNTQRHDFVTVIRLEPRNWTNCPRETVFCRQLSGEPDESYQEWYDKQEDATLKKHSTYVAVSSTGDASAPFRVRDDLGDGRYEVSFQTYCRGQKDRYISNIPSLDRDPAGERSWETTPRLVVSDKAGTSFRSASGKLYVPKDHKFIHIEQVENNTDEAPECGNGCLDNGSSKVPPVVVGNVSDLREEILSKLARLKVYAPRSGGEVSLNNRDFISSKSALFRLVREHGFREKTARELLAQATQAGIGGRALTVLVKAGIGYGPAIPEPPMGNEPIAGGGSVMTQYPQEESFEVPELSGLRTDPAVYDSMQPIQPDSGAMQAAQQAGQLGQKEIFDTAALGGLLKTVRQDSIADRYLGDLLKALDRCGRLMFLFNWHNDAFVERYGQSDAPELEDTLRNTFEMLGDLVLFLKEKDVAPMFGNAADEPNVDEAAL